MIARPRPRRILFATDGSEGAERALDLLCSLPHRRKDDVVQVVSVAVHAVFSPDSGGFGEGVAAQTAREIADTAAHRLTQCGIAADLRVVEGPTAGAIIEAAATMRADLIVIGSRGRGLIMGTLLGSVARALARHSPIPVLVVRERREAPRRILVTVDGSPDSRAAIATLSALPLPRGAEAVLLHVLPGRSMSAGADLDVVTEQHARQRALELAGTAAYALPCGISTRVEVAEGPVADRILAAATAIGADLIVLGSRGHALGTGFLQGSTADRVLSGAHCAVLVARAAERVDATEPATRILKAAAT